MEESCLKSCDHELISSTLSARGFCRVNLTGQLLADVKNFFFDICKYTLLVCEDASFNLDKILVRQLIEAIQDDCPTTAWSYLNKIMLEMAAYDRALLGYIYDMGTRPCKFNSARTLAANDDIDWINKSFFRSKDLKASSESSYANFKRRSLFLCPPNGETLHIFPPGEREFKYNLPVHQDFPYLLQSQSQITY